MDKYVKMTADEWATAHETGSDADAVRIHGFKKSEEAIGLFGLIALDMWEPTLKRCMNDCVPAILKGAWHFLGPRHDFAIAIHQIVSLSLYIGLGSSVGAKRNPATILRASVNRMFLAFADWSCLPSVAMGMAKDFEDQHFRTRFSIFVERCCMMAQSIALRNVDKFSAASRPGGGNRELDGFFRRISEAAFVTGFEAGFERQVYLRNENEYGSGEPCAEVVACERGYSMLRNGSDGTPDLEVHGRGESDISKYAMYNRAALLSRSGNFVEMNKWLERAAEAGCAEAQTRLGWQYLWGLSLCPKDGRRAEHYLKKAAERGHAMAMLYLGQLYEEDRTGLPKNGKQALHYYKMAAERVHLGGAYQGVGRIYETGNGVPADLDEAIRWYRLSADASNAYGVCALHRLGVDTSCYPEYLHRL